MTRRAHIGWKTKYAAALLKLGDVPYEHAKEMHQDQIISLYDVHHNIRHALGGGIHFSNLEPMLRAPHRAISRKDNTTIAHVKQLNRDHEDFRRLILEKEPGKPRERSSRWPSRPFSERVKR